MKDKIAEVIRTEYCNHEETQTCSCWKYCLEIAQAILDLIAKELPTKKEHSDYCNRMTHTYNNAICNCPAGEYNQAIKDIKHNLGVE